MSRTIDEEVVKMSLDTKEFESDISSSISSIEKLKSSFNFEAVAQGIQSAISNVASIGSAIGSKVSSAVSAASEGISTVKSGLSSIGEFGSSVVSKIKSGVGEIASNAKSAGSSIMSGISDIALKAGSVIGTIGSTLLGPVANLGQKVFGGFTDAAEKELTGPALWIAKRFWENITDMGMQAAQNVWHSFSSITFDTVGEGFNKYGDLLKSQKTIMAAGYDLEKVEKVLAKVQWYTDNTSYSLNDMTSNIGKFTAAGVDLDDAATAMIGIANAAARAGQGSAEAGRVMYNVSQSLGMGYMQLMDWKSIENANMATLEFKQTLIDAGVALGKLEDLGNGTYRVVGDTSDEAVFEAKKLRETLSKKWLTSEVMLKAFGTYGSFVDDVYKLAGDGTMTVTDAVKQLEAQMGSTAETAEGTVETISKIVDKTAADSGYLQAAIEVVRGNYGNDMTERFRLLEEAGFDAQKVQDIVNRAYADGITSTQGMIDAYSDLIVTTGEVTTAVGEAGATTERLGVESFKAAQQAITFQKAMDMTKEAAGSAWASVFKIVFGDLNEATELWTDFAEGLNDLLIKPVVNLKEKLLKWSDRGGRDDLLSAVTTGLSNIADLFGSVRKGMELVFPKSTTNQLVKFTKNLSQFVSGLTLTEDQLFKIQKVSMAAFNILSFGIDSIKAIGRFLSPIINSVLTAAGPVIDFLYNIFIAVGNIAHALRTSDSVYKSLLSFANGAAEAVKNLDASFKSFFGFSVLEKLEWIITKVKEGVIALRDSVMKFIGDHNFFRSITDVRKAMADIRKSIDFGAMLDSLKGKITEFVGHLDAKFKDSYGFSLIQKLKPFVELIGDAFEYARKGVADFFGQVDATNIKTLTESMSRIFGGFSLSSIVGSFGSFIIDWLRDLDTVAIAKIIKTNVKGAIDSLNYVFNEETFKDPILILNRFGELLTKQFEKIKMWAEKTGPAIKESLKAFGKKIIDGVKDVLAMFGGAKAEASEEIEDTTDEIEGELHIIKNSIVGPFAIIGDVINRIRAIDLTPIKSFLGGIGTVLLAPFVAIKNAFSKLIETLKGLDNIDTSALDEFLTNMASYKEQFTTWIIDFFTGIGPTIQSGWDKFKGKVSEVFQNIAKVISEFLDGIKQKWLAFKEAMSGFWTDVAIGLVDIKNGIIQYGKDLVDAVRVVKGWLKTAFDKLIDFVENRLGIKTLDDLLIKMGSIGFINGKFALNGLTKSLSKVVKQFKGIDSSSVNKFLENFGRVNITNSASLQNVLFDKETQKAITDSLLGFKDTLKAYQKELKAEALKDIAKAVVILAAGILVLTFVPEDKLKVPAIIVGALFGAISLMTRFMKGMESLPTAGAVMAIAGSVLVFALAITLIVRTLNKLKNVVGDGHGNGNAEFVVAIGVLAGIIAGMVGVMSYIAKLSKGLGPDMLKAGASLVLVALAVDMMVGALMVLQLANPLKLIGAAAAIGVAIIALGAGLRIAAKPYVLRGAAAMLIAAVAIDALMVALLALTGVIAAGGEENLGKALLYLVGAIAALAVPLAVLSLLGPGVLIVSASFLVMAVAVEKLGTVLGATILAIIAFSALSEDVIKNGAKNLGVFLDQVPDIMQKVGAIIKSVCQVIIESAPEIASAFLSVISSFFELLGASFAEVILGPLLGILWDIADHTVEIVQVLETILHGVLSTVNWWQLGADTSNAIVDFFFGLFGADEKAVQNMEDSFGNITTAVVDWLGKLFSGEHWENVKATVAGAWDFIGESLEDYFIGDPEKNLPGLGERLIGYGKKFVEWIGEGIAAGWKSIEDGFATLFGPLATLFSKEEGDKDASYYDSMKLSGQKAIEALTDGIESSSSKYELITAAGTATDTLIGQLGDPIVGVKTQMNGIGANSIQGLIDGAESKRAELEAKYTELADAISYVTKLELNVNSPSKVFMEIGQYTMAGLIVGVENRRDAVVRAMTGVSQSIIDSAAGTLNGFPVAVADAMSIGANVGENSVSSFALAFGQISDILDRTFDVNPTIRPSVDLSNVTAAAGYMSSMFYDPTLNPLANKAGYGMLGSDINIQNKGTDLTKVLESMADIRGEFFNMSNRVTNLQVRMDTGALVGSIVEPLDTRLGSNLSLARRGIK